MKIILQPEQLICRYVERMTGYSHAAEKHVAIGLLNSEDELVAGVIFNGYSKPNINMHIACERLSPAFVCALMDYAFNQAGCTRITGYIEQQNIHSRQFAEHLGAVLEGMMLRMTKTGGNVCIYGLQKEAAAKWLNSRYCRKLERAFT